MDPLTPTVVDERLVLPGRGFDFVEMTVRGVDGVERRRQVVRHRGAAVILPILETADGPRVLFVRNYRYAVGDWLDEVPAGGIDEGETPEDAAAREVAEETGYRAATLEPLCRFHSTPGITDEAMHVFVATGLEHVGQDLDDGELLSVHEWSPEDALAAVDDGRITDAKTMLVLLLARSRGLI